MLKVIIRYFLVFLFIPGVCFSCQKEKDPGTSPNSVTYQKMVIKPSVTYQDMIGFGGALTWYSNNILNGTKSNEIYNLMFNDLGLDILRLKNWYYPAGYPDNKSPQNMASGDITMLNASKTFFQKAKEINPQIQVLFCSWGPPASLKSNNNMNEGTLKKDSNGNFMYDEFAQYWVDVLDNIGFNPDYISIQNESSYSNSGWTTCVWGTSEGTAAAYDMAFTKVYNRIKDRPNAPVMIGPESENIPAFMNFGPLVKNMNYCPIYCWHAYNFNESSDPATIVNSLKTIPASFGDKPNLMTEYSGMSWFKTARFIQQTLLYANTSAYIYWDMVWGDSKNSMIYVNNAGDYTINPFYYVVKHFAKYIDKGYKRIDVSSSNGSVEVSGYISPDHKKITLVAINPSGYTIQYKFDLTGYTISDIKAYQTTEGNYFKDLGPISSDGPVKLTSNSITTIVLSL